MIYRAFIVLVFIAVIVGSVMLGGQQREAVSTTTVDNAAADLGYAARQARVIETGADGHPLYTLDAALIKKPPGTTEIQLQQVRLGFRDAAGHQWIGTAASGVAQQDAGSLGIVELSGDVQVSGVLPGTQTQVNISTDRLSVDTRTETVATQDPVTFTAPGAKMTAKGLSTSLTDGIVHLLSNVHATYSP
jgi:LPS export ABC transporter protein LptC